LALHKFVTTWDETKRGRNIAKHGVDLALAERFDFHTAWIREDRSEAYGERRCTLRLCLHDARRRGSYVYVYTTRDDEDRAISLRKATLGEQRRYAEES
jgi:uncharacterized DUF497 family protein